MTFYYRSHNKNKTSYPGRTTKVSHLIQDHIIRIRHHIIEGTRSTYFKTWSKSHISNMWYKIYDVKSHYLSIKLLREYIVTHFFIGNSLTRVGGKHAKNHIVHRFKEDNKELNEIYGTSFLVWKCLVRKITHFYGRPV